MGLARRIARGGAVGAGLVAAALVAVAAWVALPIPASVLAAPSEQGVTVEDRHGIALRTTRAADGSRARWVALGEIDPDLIRAFIAVEDRRFFEHAGVDHRAVARAVRDNLRHGRVVSGASTITMQTARLLRAGSGGEAVEGTVAGKVAQAMWALRLEMHLDKQRILEQYLNRIHLGQGAVGVAAATALYFGASPGEVSAGQAATLAGLARAPSSDNPLVSPRRARAHRTVALLRMRRAGYLSEAEAGLAESEPLLAASAAPRFLAPHFTTRVLQWAQRDGGAASSGVLRTSLDLELQRALELEVRHTVDVLAGRGARHAAAVVLDNLSGQVLAWVGSPDFWSDTAGQTDMVVSARQPGSALKPFLYGLAFDRGYTAASILADVARTYQTASGPYRPRNYDQRFRGPVRAREALGSSYNVPAVALAEHLRAGSLLETLRLAGFSSLGRSAEHYGLGLALGNGDVTLLELANAYRALANGGVWRPHHWLAEASAPLAIAAPERRVMSERSAALVLDILSDAEARLPGFGVETPFDFPFRVAAKTGTSRHFTDNWAVGLTGRFTVAVWVGNFSGRPMDGVSGVSGAGPLLHRAVMVTATRYAPGDLPRPEEAGLVPVRICRLSGLRAAHDCPHAAEWFTPGAEPNRDCDWHQGDRVALPVEFAEWAASQREGRQATSAPPSMVPHTPAPGAGFRITSPRDGDRYQVPPGVDARYATVALRASGTSADTAVRWFVNGRAVAESRFRLSPGEHVIEARRTGGERDRVIVIVQE